MHHTRDQRRKLPTSPAARSKLTLPSTPPLHADPGEALEWPKLCGSHVRLWRVRVEPTCKGATLRSHHAGRGAQGSLAGQRANATSEHGLLKRTLETQKRFYSANG